MSWLFSRALVEDCSELTHLGSDLCVRLKSENYSDAYLLRDKTNECSRLSQYGMTFGHLEQNNGGVVLMFFLEDSRVRRLAVQRVEKTSEKKTSGRTCTESSALFLPVMCSLKTYQQSRSSWRKRTLRNLVTKPKCFPFPRKTWVLTMHGKDFGFLHTPTTKANYAARSMQKWQACRNFVEVFGKPTPENQEWLMGLPIGWTDMQPLETDRFQQWQRQLCGHLRMLNGVVE